MATTMARASNSSSLDSLTHPINAHVDVPRRRKMALVVSYEERRRFDSYSGTRNLSVWWC